MCNRWVSNSLSLLLTVYFCLALAGCHRRSGSEDNSPASSPTSTDGNARTYAVVDTGQTTCYDSATGVETACTGTGYDADYAGNQPSYTVSADGLTVTDNVTGLTWQQSTDTNGDGLVNYDDKMYQSDAAAYCGNLVLGGRDDWRLPSIKEAYSLILFTGKDASSYTGTDTSVLTPFLSGVFDWAFGDLSSGIDRIIDAQYASSTLYVSTTMNDNPTMFGVNFVDGRIKGYPLDTKKFYVRCVAGNTDYGINRFVDNGDRTISDNATGLMWQQNDSDSSDWDDAVAQCESATTAGHTDWRLPNAKELQSIVDYTRSPDTTGSAAISPLFNATPIVNEDGKTDWGYYWASTTHLDYDGAGSNAAYVAFGRALGYMNGKIMDVHGAGAQRANDKLDVAAETGVQSATNAYGTFYYKGPQGDILRNNNKVRCVRDMGTAPTATAYYTLFAPLQSKKTYLIDAATYTIHTWQADTRPALSVYLLSNGELLRTEKTGTLPSTFSGNVGGSGGVIEILDWDGNVVWSKTLATDTYLSNHDVAVLPNGNILAIVWEAKSAADVLALGRTSVSDPSVWAGAVYEICRHSATNNCTDGDIVWRWSSWDHVAQDVDSGIPDTYVANISDHPDRIDLNYVPSKSSTGFADWMHFNGIDYNADKDEILISVHNFNEYWIIDHGDSTKGILARVGNPAAYGGTGSQVLFGQHDAHWIPAGLPGAGNILVFNNGLNRPDGAYSSVDEFCDTGTGCTPGELVSSYSQGPTGDFYAENLGSAQRLPNGHTLVCEGTDGRLFEYNADNEIVWEYDYGGEVFRAIDYDADYSGLAKLQQ
jgi:Protein of unknown function (DUF1566)/Arylsulfotransferase (ASST)